MVFHQRAMTHVVLGSYELIMVMQKFKCLSWCGFTETAGAGRACGAAEGPSALAAERTALTAGETAGRIREDAKWQPRFSRVLWEIWFWERWPSHHHIAPQSSLIWLIYAFKGEVCPGNGNLLFIWLAPQAFQDKDELFFFSRTLKRIFILAVDFSRVKNK